VSRHAVLRAYAHNHHATVIDVEQSVLVLHSVDSAHTAHVARMLRYHNCGSVAGNPELHVFARRRVPPAEHRRLVLRNVLRDGNAAQHLTKVQGGGVFVPRDTRAHRRRLCVCGATRRFFALDHLPGLLADAVDGIGSGKTEFGPTSGQDDDFLTAQRKHQGDVADDCNAPYQIDLEDTVANIAAIARIPVVSDVVAERREDVFLRTEHAYEQSALAVNLNFVTVPACAQCFGLLLYEIHRHLVDLDELHMIPQGVDVCAGDIAASAVHFKDGEKSGVWYLGEHIQVQWIGIVDGAFGTDTRAGQRLAAAVHLTVATMQTVFIVPTASFEHNMAFRLQVVEQSEDGCCRRVLVRFSEFEVELDSELLANVKDIGGHHIDVDALHVLCLW